MGRSLAGTNEPQMVRGLGRVRPDPGPDQRGGGPSGGGEGRATGEEVAQVPAGPCPATGEE